MIGLLISYPVSAEWTNEWMNYLFTMLAQYFCRSNMALSYDDLVFLCDWEKITIVQIWNSSRLL